MGHAVTHDMSQTHDPAQCHCVRCRPLERPCACTHCERHKYPTAAYRITDDMLAAAAKIDDLDAALKGVMDQVGIDEGGVAGMVFSGEQDSGWWRTADVHYRLAMLREWRDAELAYNLPYPLNGQDDAGE